MEQTATNGTWGGTPPIEFAHRWQRCSTTDTDSCVDIEDAEDPAYVPVAADQGERLRVVVTAENAFPTLGLIRQWSAITAPVGANPSPNFLPGAAQIAAPQIAVDAPGSATLPQSGDVLRAVGGLFQPAATSRSYVWLRCAAAGDDCAPLPGETYPTLALDDEDVGRRFRVIVTGHNVHGAKAAPESGPTNTVFPADPAPTSPPVVLGDAVVGETLVGSVGSWPFAVRAGRTTVRIATRAGRRAVPAGRYRVAVRLTDAAGNRSAERRVSLRVRSR